MIQTLTSVIRGIINKFSKLRFYEILEWDVRISESTVCKYVRKSIKLKLNIFKPMLKYRRFDVINLGMYYSMYAITSIYSRTRLRRTRLGNNKKYVLTEVRLIRVHK